MAMEDIRIYGHGIKGTPVLDRWNSRPFKELACLFIEDNRQSENVKYLLENYLEQVIQGISICMKELKLEKVRIYLSAYYRGFLKELEQHGMEVAVVEDKKLSEKDVFREDTLVHHAETMLALSRSFSEKNYIPKKIVSITGDVKNPGVYEVPFGITLREMIEEYGNGSNSQKAIKFVQVGGNTGTVFTDEELDTAFIYSNLMGSGTMLETAKIDVYNIETCMVGWAYKKMLVNSKETCGKCVYCREGIYQLYRIMKDATEGKGKDGDMELADELCETIKAGTLCDFGKSAPNPLHTAMIKFKDEFEKHIERKICNTLSCISYADYFIDPTVCNGCGACMGCHQNAVRGGEHFIHVIDTDLCDKCGECETVCSIRAVKRYGTIKPLLPSEPIAVGSFQEGGPGVKKGLGRKRRKL
ncbi:NADH-ubiquinone oxidoreductase-F iron-sulfur binding region domain-containing protein [Clostridium sp. Marseille-P2415]|uniref:NADH-ubiquinone oxidoreductase-F iron-sulfur binding region domain-containing protein n=1 Tax=Clostridium sp. Marseille-P2415 TaxID=1805471 RepID=UPI0009887011|nr:NADH-ubiquinone oxidoreductase-F iron-sulfur binding region domain-containing protein [Clostridium sp. Marseille-P2415]